MPGFCFMDPRSHHAAANDPSSAIGRRCPGDRHRPAWRDEKIVTSSSPEQIFIPAIDCTMKPRRRLDADDPLRHAFQVYAFQIFAFQVCCKRSL